MEAFGLQDCWNTKPLLSGREVCSRRLPWKMTVAVGVSRLSCSRRTAAPSIPDHPLAPHPFQRRPAILQHSVREFAQWLQVMSVMGVQGKQVGKVRDQLADWQLANPSASAQECKEWLEANKETVLALANAAVDAEKTIAK